jgi:FkbM family methyltransferase
MAMLQAEVESAYKQAVPFVIRLLHDWFGLHTLEFLPRDSSPLRVRMDGAPLGHPVKIVADPVMSPFILGRHVWQVEELEFAKRVCIGSAPITLIDVGANMGLFSRQLIVALPTIVETFAYEPEPLNFACLVQNLAPFRDNVRFIQAALSNSAGNMDLLLNPDNVGNFSFNPNAMPTKHSKMSVQTKDAADECTTWMASGRRIFYKSDTEGFDEVVAARILPDVWPHIFAGIMEILRVDKPPFDSSMLATFLDNFPNKVLLANSATHVAEARVSTAEVMNFVHGNDRLHRDLGFWR